MTLVSNCNPDNPLPIVIFFKALPGIGIIESCLVSDCDKLLDLSVMTVQNLLNDPVLIGTVHSRVGIICFFAAKFIGRLRIVQKCRQECKLKLYQPIRCYQGPFQSVWCFNRMVSTTGLRGGWYRSLKQQTRKSGDDSFNWSQQHSRLKSSSGIMTIFHSYFPADGLAHKLLVE